MAQSKRPQARRRTEAAQWAEVLPGYARMVLKFSALVMLVATGYLLYAIFGKYEPGSERILDNIGLVGQVLAVSGSVTALCVIIVTFEEVAFAVVCGMVGAAFLWGMPFLIAGNLRDASGQIGQEIHRWGTTTGIAIILIAGLRLLYEIKLQLTVGSQRRRQAQKEEVEPVGPKKKATKSMLPWTPCWQMPFCHEAIKEMCPAYKAHKTCWRYDSGCNCDPHLIEGLIRSGGVGGGSRDARTRQTQEAYVRSDLEADAVKLGQKRTIPCAQCAIYNEHQRAKYKFINPLAIIATIVAMIVGFEPLMSLYHGFVTAGTHLVNRFGFGGDVDAQQWFDYLDSPTMRVFFIVILGLLILSYVLRAVEWAILVKKI